MFRLHCSPDVPEPPGPETEARLRAVALRALVRHPVGGVVDAVLTDDAEIRRLNRDFRDRDAATDVLSFSFREAAADGSSPDLVVGDAEAVDGGEPAGEVYISLQRAAEQADDLGVDLEQELARLLVHGLLHLAGYDHQTESELVFMERETEAVLAEAAG